MTKTALQIDHLDGYAFEDLTARIMKRIGYTDIKVTQKSGDKGKDIIMRFDKGKENYPVVVECKHQNFVGRPVIQKLQGAMLHEKGDSSFIKGIVVTSGKFSPTVQEYVNEINKDHEGFMKIELIDGRKLKNLCKDHNIILLNGKVQILTNNVVVHPTFEKINNEIKKQYEKIIGHNDNFLKININKNFYPCYFINYNVDSQTSTTVGCIYNVKEKNQSIILDGKKGNMLNELHEKHFFSNFPHLTTLNTRETNQIIPFEYTENDIEQEAFNLIIDKYEEEVSYYGNNNRRYEKTCKPKFRDIDINKAIPIFLPRFSNNITLLKNRYSQEIFTNKNDLLFTKNQLEECVQCKRKSFFFNQNKYLCPSCGKILCSLHKRLDAYDKTPVCIEHAIPRRLFIQNVHFVSKKNLTKFNKEWQERNFFSKLWMDKIMVGTSSTGLTIFFLFLISVL